MDLRKTPAWLFLLSILTGCTTVGSGYRTVVRAPCDVDLAHLNEQAKAEAKPAELCDYLSKRYSNLIAPSGAEGDALVLRIDPQGRPVKPEKVRTGTWWLPTYKQFREFLRLKYGSEDFRPAELSFNAHDRTVTPAYFATDPRATWATAVTTLLATNTIPEEERIRLQELLEARLRHVPDLGASTAPHHTEVCDSTACQESCTKFCEKKHGDQSARDACWASCIKEATVYHYYPRISVDFSSSFLSNSPADRLSYLAMVVRLRYDDLKKKPAGLPDDDLEDKPKFIEFRPKDADIASFSRGELSQVTSLEINSDLEKASGGDAGIFDLGFGHSETFASKLADSIEKRSTGILEDGRTFFVDLRSLREIRIAGSYNFDLMLEVPSRLDRSESTFTSKAEPDKLVADIFLIGVVRHVHARGRIGTFNRVPESENDHVFEQVVLRVLPGQELWRASGSPWTDQPKAAEPPTPCKLQVLTNREDAAFTVRNESGVVFEGASGRKALIEVPACGKVDVTFLPVITEDNVLIVSQGGVKKIDFGQGPIQSVEGAYLPRK